MAALRSDGDNDSENEMGETEQGNIHGNSLTLSMYIRIRSPLEFKYSIFLLLFASSC